MKATHAATYTLTLELTDVEALALLRDLLIRKNDIGSPENCRVLCSDLCKAIEAMLKGGEE